MRYVSTRGAAPSLDFGDTLLAGLATDGGLYVPDTWPKLPNDLAPHDYAEIAAAVCQPFVEPTFDRDHFAEIVAATYADFRHPDVAPLVDLGDDGWLMELFHGPTLAFKDYALQMVGRLFDHTLRERNERVTIVGATSGDTGSAAIEACRSSDAIDIFIMFPDGRVSEVQRRQMTTVDAPGVHNIAIEGNFDDCQDMVKALFADETFRSERNLSAVNSINWARVMAQVAYYVVAWRRLCPNGGPIGFTVPTGNFGNIFAGWVAQRMGLPIDQLVVASNSNDILTRLFTTGTMSASEVIATISPSMDIGVSSNLERLLFELYGRDGEAIATLLGRFRDEGTVAIEADLLSAVSETFAAARLDDAETSAVIADVYTSTGMLVDPHSAVGIGATRKVANLGGRPHVSLATAHPAKFGDAVEAATGVRPALPPHMAHIMEAEERFTVLPNDIDAVRAFIAETLA